jgi:hypothetical protein
MSRGPKQRVGQRPRAKSGRDKRQGLSLSISAGMRERLEAATAGRSLSAETETLLEHALREERTVPNTLAFFYGPHTAGLMLLIGDLMAAERVWLDDPVRFVETRRKVELLFECLAPDDLPTPINREVDEHVRLVLGHLFAPKPHPRFLDWALERWHLVGEAVRKRVARRIERQP